MIRCAFTLLCSSFGTSPVLQFIVPNTRNLKRNQEKSCWHFEPGSDASNKRNMCIWGDITYSLNFCQRTAEHNKKAIVPYSSGSEGTACPECSHLGSVKAHFPKILLPQGSFQWSLLYFSFQVYCTTAAYLSTITFHRLESNAEI